MPDQKIFKTINQKMESALTHLKAELGGLRGGRASLSLLDHIQVDCYGTPTPLKQVGSLTLSDGRFITIQPWDLELIKNIEKAIIASNLGSAPANDGKIIRLNLPPLSEERRKELVKVSKQYGENAKVHIRGIRREGNGELKRLQKDSILTEDRVRRGEHEIQKMTDSAVKKIDDLLKKKEEEILEI